jgi:hypothetical protein
VSGLDPFIPFSFDPSSSVELHRWLPVHLSLSRRIWK